MNPFTAKPPESGSNFRPAFFFLSKNRRAALSAVYAYCRAVDDIVDIPGGSPPEDGLDFWRQELERLFAGNPTCPVSEKLLPAVKEYGLEKEDFLLILGGVQKDLNVSRYGTFEELEEYLYGVASAVGFHCVRIFGYDRPQAREHAKWMGYAVQMTNILRDVSSDAARGRIYLPQEDLRKFGCRESDIINGVYSLSFIELMRFEAARVREFYAKARGLVLPDYSRRMLPALIMGGLYEALLSRMEKLDFDVLGEKISLNPVRKIVCILDAWRKTC
ncbi:MAG: squalene/phytoene synthase family protein [bacterium]